MNRCGSCYYFSECNHRNPEDYAGSCYLTDFYDKANHPTEYENKIKNLDKLASIPDLIID